MADLPIFIAVVDNDEQAVAERQAIIAEEYDFARVITRGYANAGDVIDALESEAEFFDVILSDLYMPARGEDPCGDGTPDTGGLALFRWLQQKRAVDVQFRSVQLLWISRQPQIPREVLRLHREASGWVDYVTHPREHANRTDFRLRLDDAIARAAPAWGKAPEKPDIMTLDPAMSVVLDTATRAASSKASVLITGEQGVGKELIARMIHARSKRCDFPLVKVNCSAIPDDLIESELFGHTKGSFTGATTERKGKFALADKGTIFLDEVADMSPKMQSKVLRVLQEGEIQRIGESKELKVDVRVITATNKDPQKEVADGRFREDLLFRLNVIPLDVPPLRERRADIIPLARHYLLHYARANEKAVQGISQAAADRLVHYHWPGNIRELQNVMERAVTLSSSAQRELDVADLPPAISLEKGVGGLTSEEQIYLESARRNGFVVSRVAQELRVSRQTVYNRWRKSPRLEHAWKLEERHAEEVHTRREAAEKQKLKPVVVRVSPDDNL